MFGPPVDGGIGSRLQSRLLKQWPAERITKAGSMVTVLLFGLTLRNSVGESELEVKISDPVSIKDLIESESGKLTRLLPFMNKGELLVTINRKVGSMDSIVRDGDTVKLTHQSNPTYDGAMWQNP